MPPASNLKVRDSRAKLGFQHRNCSLVFCIAFSSATHKKDTSNSTVTSFLMMWGA